MNLEYQTNSSGVNWEELRQDLVKDEFHNGRTSKQLQISFENSQVQVYVFDGERCIGTARALSDGVCNAYVVDVWTQTGYRQRGIASRMMEKIISRCPGQHIYLFTDDAVDFYKKNGFTERPVGLEIISGQWLQNDSLGQPRTNLC
ncbi:MAG: GNAT family N-acetyltransferase [Proteobacteria bacterium]|nr:GNAT family N-acetyltransferase [Pseudomonadota bacterium]